MYGFKTRREHNAKNPPPETDSFPKSNEGKGKVGGTEPAPSRPISDCGGVDSESVKENLVCKCSSSIFWRDIYGGIHCCECGSDKHLMKTRVCREVVIVVDEPGGQVFKPLAGEMERQRQHRQHQQDGGQVKTQPRSPKPTGPPPDFETWWGSSVEVDGIPMIDVGDGLLPDGVDV